MTNVTLKSATNANELLKWFINFWQEAENFGTFKDDPYCNYTYYEGYMIIERRKPDENGERRITVSKDGYSAVFKSYGSKYEDTKYVIRIRPGK